MDTSSNYSTFQTSQINSSESSSTPTILIEALRIVRIICREYLTIIFAVCGTITNMINILILTRKNMRSSTNYYLTAMAIMDMLFLNAGVLNSLQVLFSEICISRFVSEIQNYSKIFITTISFNSVSIICAFTIERYIAGLNFNFYT